MSHSSSTTPPNAETVLNALAEVAHAGVVLVDTLVRYRVRPVAIYISVNGKRSLAPMNVPDNQEASASLAFSDSFGDQVPEPGPVTWSVSDNALASVTPNASDDTQAVVRVLSGTGTFRLRATAANLSGESEDLVITPGAAAAANITVTLQPTPAP